MFCTWTAWVQSPALLLSSWVTRGESVKRDDNKLALFHEVVRLEGRMHSAVKQCVTPSRASISVDCCFITNIIF